MIVFLMSITIEIVPAAGRPIDLGGPPPSVGTPLRGAELPHLPKMSPPLAAIGSYSAPS